MPRMNFFLYSGEGSVNNIGSTILGEWCTNLYHVIRLGNDRSSGEEWMGNLDAKITINKREKKNAVAN